MNNNAMELVTRVRIEVWVDDNEKRSWQPTRSVCFFKVDFKDTRTQEEKDRYLPSPGLSYISFIMEEPELLRLTRSSKIPIPDRWRDIQLEDIAHRLHASGDWCTFYDFETPRDSYGRMSIPFARLELPKAFWKYVYRIASFVWAEKRKANAAADPKDYRYSREERYEFEIPLSILQRFTSRYGCAKGGVVQEFSDRLKEEIQKRPQLREKVEQVTTIARNSTHNIYQKATIRIYNDMDGYYWTAHTPSGHLIMNGGIVNHSKNPANDEWSIHT